MYRRAMTICLKNKQSHSHDTITVKFANDSHWLFFVMWFSSTHRLFNDPSAIHRYSPRNHTEYQFLPHQAAIGHWRPWNKNLWKKLMSWRKMIWREVICPPTAKTVPIGLKKRLGTPKKASNCARFAYYCIVAHPVVPHAVLGGSEMVFHRC